MEKFDLNHMFMFEVPFTDTNEKRTIEANQSFRVVAIKSHFLVCKDLKNNQMVNVPVTVFKAFAVDLVSRAEMQRQLPKTADSMQ